MAWLLNLRGADVPYNPVFVAHLLIGPDRGAPVRGARQDRRLNCRRELAADGVIVEDYAAAPQAALRDLAPGEASARRPEPRHARHGEFGARRRAHHRADQPEYAPEEPQERVRARTGARRDGTGRRGAVRVLRVAGAGAGAAGTITELTIDEQLTARRARRPGFVSLSFGTIAGFNANGAAPHYRATADSHATICDASGCGNGLLLIDSGGQYQAGTTDITRVVAIGATTPAQRRDFTLVLKGMIALSGAQFPRGTRSPLLDALARAPIWAAGIDYGHGTGHGVGYFLNVHEGPQGITPYLAPDPTTAMESGMITSNEPGIYRPGQWGVRIENLLATVPAAPGEFGDFLRFETLTLCPIDRRCIDTSLLRQDERSWIDAYHRRCAERLAPLLTGPALDWLHRFTAALSTITNSAAVYRASSFSFLNIAS